MKTKKSDLIHAVVLLVCIAIVLLSIARMGDSYAKELQKSHNRTDLYIEYVVQPGDTLWGIACREYPEVDPRKAVYIIRQENNIESPGKLQSYQRIWIPTEIK